MTENVTGFLPKSPMHIFGKYFTIFNEKHYGLAFSVQYIIFADLNNCMGFSQK